MALASQLLDVLVCPEDKGPLLYIDDENVLYNPRLHRIYTVRNGNIPVMLVEEAKTVDDAEHNRLVGKAGSQTGAAGSQTGKAAKAPTDDSEKKDT